MMQKEQWQGFEGRLWKEEINVRDLSRTTTHLTREILHSLQIRPKQQTSSGASFRNSRKKNVQKAAFWIWKQKWYLLLPLTVQVISAKN